MVHQTKEKISEIMDVYFSESLPADLEKDILSWIMYDGHREEKEEKLEELWNKIVHYESRGSEEQKAVERLGRIKELLGLPPVASLQQHDRPMRPKLRGRRFVGRIAAVLIPLLTVGGALFFTLNNRNTEPVAREIRLAAGNVQEYIVLSDGSQVWLNSGAVLTYPETFEKERPVYLEGEAYFKVAPDEKRTFIVNTKDVAVRVLGTEFNVRTVPETGKTIVTLNSGKVEVMANGNSYLMDKRGQFIYHAEAAMAQAEEVETGISFDWRTIAFDYETLDKVFNVLSDRYNIPIAWSSPVITEEAVTIKLKGDEPLDVVLTRLSEITAAFTYKIEANKVIIHTTDFE